MTESQKFEYFRCMTCGFSGAITEPEIAKHRSRCAGGTTEAFSRLEAIRQIEEEIALQRHWLALVSQSDKESLSPDAATRTIIERTLGRLEAWRDEMKRGMRA